MYVDYTTVDSATFWMKLCLTLLAFGDEDCLQFTVMTL